ncbi:competence protein ComK [Bacillus andreraoultii]|uniref:competence protein ComK n=1 Tax=Bacillus andreraoultii TaxID=1499685 RepID=UPI000539E7A2|nr:competence protein ComK [Bacillus andreraoultii]
MFKEDYFINGDTCAIVSDFDHYGKEYSIVFERGRRIIVLKPPNKIVKDSYIFRGFPMEGAQIGARFLLKRRKDVPIVYSINPGIILIRCMTADRRGTVWLVNSQILDFEPYHKARTTKIQFHGGHNLIVGITSGRLQKRRQEGSFLQLLVSDRLDIKKTQKIFYEESNNSSLVSEKRTEYFIKEEILNEKQLDYEVT